MTSSRISVVYLLGAGHCGSTLLSLLLNAHSRCIAVSEISKLDSAIRDDDPTLHSTAWRAIARGYEQRSHASFAALDLGHPPLRDLVRWSDADVARWAEPRAELFSSIVGHTGRPWIVDASKSWQPLYLMHRSKRFDLRVVHLVRDVRGVVHSYSKKYGNLRHGFSKWLKPGIVAMALSPVLHERWLRVRYEDLAARPAPTLSTICEHIGIPYEPAMLEFRDHEWLGIGGNRMSKRADSKIRLDERWRQEMSQFDRWVVGVLGTPLNRLYGY